MNKITHVVERKTFELALNAALRKKGKYRNKGYVRVVNAIEAVLGDVWRPEAYSALREALGKEGKWTGYFDKIIAESDPAYLKGLMMSLGYEGGFAGVRQTQKKEKELGVKIPWIILFDPTSACNLHCTGCWASEYKKTLNLSYEDMDSLVNQGKALGIHEYLMTGGEPLCRKKDIINLAKKHSDCGFMIFTNGTLIDQPFCDALLACKNIILILSIEGFEEATDKRRGNGVFRKVTDAMDLLKKNGLIFGTSVCYTRENIGSVTSDEFFDFLIYKGAAFSWYFHYMPVGNDAVPDLLPTPAQREYMYHRIREIRGFKGGKPIFLMDFQNDGEFVDGCVAGGKAYCHINSNGDVEPCVFIHYSGANIRSMSLKECLNQPLFRVYQKSQPFNRNMLQPCPMLENPEMLRKLVAASGAYSTDMLSPESSDHLCEKCDDYAKEWSQTAQLLWANRKNKKAGTGS